MRSIRHIPSSKATVRTSTARAREDEDRLRRRAGFVVVGCFILAIGVTIAVWLVLGQSILKRLGALRQGALSVSAGLALAGQAAERGRAQTQTTELRGSPPLSVAFSCSR